ncbi:hypothetical protein EBS02_00695 [bacterium]|nr:hypothetical protein [bacterium]
MSKPEIKILSVSNVYSRLMHFQKKGDVELGHYHSYDHGTLLSKGKLQVDMLNDHNDDVTSTKIFVAPTFIFIDKNKRHRLTAIEDDTLAVCIHALRTIDEEIIDPDFFIEEVELADSHSDVNESRRTIGEVMLKRGLKYKVLAN